MTDAGTHALLKKWADAVALRTVHRGVYSPDSTRTVSWPSLENCAWSTLDTPVALVKLTHPGVAQPHSLTDPLLSLFDNNPNLQAIVLQLHDSDARAVVEHVKKSYGGANRGMSLYLREWEMQDGSPGIHVSGDVAASWRKWECKAQQVQRGHWEDTAPLYSLHSQSTMGATRITSRMSLLMSYWPMAFVLGATSEHRILPVYGRIPPSIRPYTWKYTAVYSKYTAKDLC